MLRIPVNIPKPIIMSSNDKMSDKNVEVYQSRRFICSEVARVSEGRPVMHSKPTRMCSTNDQKRILQALEDLDCDERSDIGVYECSTH